MFTAIAAICIIYTVADIGTTFYLVRKHGVQELRRRANVLFFG